MTKRISKSNSSKVKADCHNPVLDLSTTLNYEWTLTKKIQKESPKISLEYRLINGFQRNLVYKFNTLNGKKITLFEKSEFYTIV